MCANVLFVALPVSSSEVWPGGSGDKYGGCGKCKNDGDVVAGREGGLGQCVRCDIFCGWLGLCLVWCPTLRHKKWERSGPGVLLCRSG